MEQDLYVAYRYLRTFGIRWATPVVRMRGVWRITGLSLHRAVVDLTEQRQWPPSRLPLESSAPPSTPAAEVPLPRQESYPSTPPHSVQLRSMLVSPQVYGGTRAVQPLSLGDGFIHAARKVAPCGDGDRIGFVLGSGGVSVVEERSFSAVGA